MFEPKWKIWAQCAEDADDQAIYVTLQGDLPDEDLGPDAIHSPSKTGLVINSLESARKWAHEFYKLPGEVVEYQEF